MKYQSTNIPPSALKCMSKSDRAPLGKAGLTTAEAAERCEKMAEREMHETFSKWLQLHGMVFIHSRMDRATTCARGVPDFCCWFNGQIALIEFKVVGADLRDSQREFIFASQARNQTLVFVTNSVAGAMEHFKKQTGFKL